MSYRVEIRRIGESGVKVGEVHHLTSSTVEEAIDLARLKINETSKIKSALIIEIFDGDKQLVMSYTSHRSAEIAHTQ